MKGFFVVFVTVSVMSWMAARAHTLAAERLNDESLYKPIQSLILMYSGVLGLAVALLFAGVRGPVQDRTVTGLLGMLFSALVILSWPKTVYFDEAGLRQRSWYGRWTRISWSEASTVEERRDGSVVVRADHGKIYLSKYHAGRDEFLREVQRRMRHCRKTYA
jgi:hypothetical protein